jgi:hypothetical protein
MVLSSATYAVEVNFDNPVEISSQACEVTAFWKNPVNNYSFTKTILQKHNDGCEVKLTKLDKEIAFCSLVAVSQITNQPLTCEVVNFKGGLRLLQTNTARCKFVCFTRIP